MTKEDAERQITEMWAIALYKWLYDRYVNPGDKIIDTHGGSMSSAIAAYDMGFDLDIWELDHQYFEEASNRVMNHHLQKTQQKQLFQIYNDIKIYR